MPIKNPSFAMAAFKLVGLINVAVSNAQQDLNKAKVAQQAIVQFKTMKRNLVPATYADKAKLREIGKLYDLQCSGLDKRLKSYILNEEEKLARAQEAKALKDKEIEAKYKAMPTLFSKLESILAQYKKARIADQRDIQKEFKVAQSELTGLINAVPSNIRAREQRRDLHSLSTQFNQRTLELELADAQNKGMAIQAANKASHIVRKASVQELILGLAPEEVKKDIQQLLEGVSKKDIKALMSVDNKKGDTGVASDMRQLSQGKTGTQQELAAFNKLGQAKQADLLTALITGEGDIGQMSKTAQIALMSLALKHLAQQKNLDAAKQGALTVFLDSMNSMVKAVHSDKPTFLSVLVEVKDSHGNKELQSFHINVRALLQNTVNISAELAVQLLRVGVTADTKRLFTLTSGEQAAAFIQMQGRALTSKSNALSLDDLTQMVLMASDSKALLQLTGGSEQDAQLLVSNLTQQLAPANGELSLVNLLKAFTVVKNTQAMVLDPIVMAKLRETPALPASHASLERKLLADSYSEVFIGGDSLNRPSRSLGKIHTPVSKTPYTTSKTKLTSIPEEPAIWPQDSIPAAPQNVVVNPVWPIKFKAASKTADTIENKKVDDKIKPPKHKKKKVSFPDDIPQGDNSVDIGIPPTAAVKKEAVKSTKVNSAVIHRFDDVLTEFNKCHKRLQEKYSAKSQIVAVSLKLIIQLNQAKQQYKVDGNLAQFKKACLAHIQDAKGAFNTHRDKPMIKYLGDLWEMLKNIFFTKEKKQNTTNRSNFFGSSADERTTKAGNELYTLHKSLEILLDPEMQDLDKEEPTSGAKLGG